ncbi:MAG: DoxX family protein [Gemmatimonadota bacterium]
MPILRRSDWGLLILRVGLGLVFFFHGWAKLLGHQISFVNEMLQMAGWTLPEAILWLVAIVELAAGIALLLGLWSRTAALVLAIEMVVAVALFHLRQGFFIVSIPNVPLAYGFEYHVALVSGLVCVALGGPGRWALEDRLGRGRAPVAAD